MSVLAKAILWTPAINHFGFCDRLRRIVAGAVFAEALGAKLLVKWTPDAPCPVDYLDVFHESEYFSTRWNADAYEILQHWDYDLNEMPLDLSRKVCQERFSLSDEFVMQRWAEILGSLEPLPEIARKIEAIRRRTDPPRMLGIHLRRTDVLDCPGKDITRENVGVYDAALWMRVTEAVAGGGIDHLYLASDDQAYFKDWKEKAQQASGAGACPRADLERGTAPNSRGRSGGGSLSPHCLSQGLWLGLVESLFHRRSNGREF